jgi:hypothetical protein
MRALTLVEHAVGTISPSYAAKHLPLDRITKDQLDQIECLAARRETVRQAEAYALEVLTELERAEGRH